MDMYLLLLRDELQEQLTWTGHEIDLELECYFYSIT